LEPLLTLEIAVWDCHSLFRRQSRRNWRISRKQRQFPGLRRTSRGSFTRIRLIGHNGGIENRALGEMLTYGGKEEAGIIVIESGVCG
jgi:hypothetical protein